MNKMIVCILSASLIFCGLSFSIAQTSRLQKDETTNARQLNNQETDIGSNLVKVNLAALPISNFSFQYERAITNKVSAAIGLRLMPQGNLPLKSAIEKLINDDEAWENFQKLEMKNFAITPEVRFYTGNVFRGFYIAPFVRYASYNAKMPYSFEYEDTINGFQEEEIPLDGRISAFTGGLMIGAQWQLSKFIYLDWWMLGPHFGSAKGNISGNKSLSQEEQDGLRDELGNLDDVFFIDGYEVNSSGAHINIKGPWGGVRAGVALGLRF